MPKTLVCPVCQTWQSSKTLGSGNRCPACGRLLKAMNAPPVIYWRVVGVALATAALFVITTIFALKAWAEGKKPAASDSGKGSVKSVQPEIRESPLAPVLKSKENSQPADSFPRPEAIPSKPPARPAKEEMVAKVAKSAPSGFN